MFAIKKTNENTLQNRRDAVKTVLQEFMVLNVYIVKFKRLRIKELSAPLGNNPKKAKEGNYKDKNKN